MMARKGPMPSRTNVSRSLRIGKQVSRRNRAYKKDAYRIKNKEEGGLL
jgi:hypothetical protein